MCPKRTGVDKCRKMMSKSAYPLKEEETTTESDQEMYNKCEYLSPTNSKPKSNVSKSFE